MTLGRNTPCPCGSGKKLKRCCVSEYGAEFKEDWALGQRNLAAAKRDDGFPSNWADRPSRVVKMVRRVDAQRYHERFQMYIRRTFFRPSQITKEDRIRR